MKKSIRIIHWMPRILSIVAILFVSKFALDVFDLGLSGIQQLKALAMHLIPSFVLTLMLIFAWRYELHGGVAFITLGTGFTPFVFMGNYNMNHSLITSLVIIISTTIPFMIVGVLFILSYFLKRKNKEKETV